MKQLRTLGGKTLQRRFLHASPLLAQARLVKGLTPEEAEKYEFQPVQPKHQVVWDGVKEENQWTEESRRVGVVALKCGMVAEYDEWGQRVPLTVLKVRCNSSHSRVSTLFLIGGFASWRMYRLFKLRIMRTVSVLLSKLALARQNRNE